MKMSFIPVKLSLRLHLLGEMNGHTPLELWERSVCVSVCVCMCTLLSDCGWRLILIQLGGNISRLQFAVESPADGHVYPDWHADAQSG